VHGRKQRRPADAALLEADAGLAVKKVELGAARDQLVLRERYRWAERAYGELEAVLGLSRTLGTSISDFPTYEAIVVRLQDVVTHSDLLRANPLIGSDTDLCQQISRYISALAQGLWADWNAAHGEREPSRPDDWVPVDQLGRELADGVGLHIRDALTSL
jgi:hypothetical protein